MILCTDLDNTLLYSSQKVASEDLETLVPVDPHAHSRKFSYMTATAYDQYMKHYHDNQIIFVTARGLSKLQRLCLPLPSTYIAAAGAIIVRNGERDIDWEAYLLHEQKSTGIESIQKVKSALEQESWVLKSIDNKYLMCDTQKNSFIELNRILILLEGMGWDTIIESHYLYFLPKNVNKGKALQYALPSQNDSIIGAGDGALDITMIEHVNKFVIPKHSTLLPRFPEDNRIRHTANHGIRASDEIFYICF